MCDRNWEFLTQGGVNTLMAGMNHARKERASYSHAGYVGTYDVQEDRELYIAREPAGSAQDDLRDFNRMGYRSERPWNETPMPVFETETASVAVPSSGRRVRQESFFDRVAYHARRERKDAMMCVVLFAIILMMTAAWGQKLVEGKRVQDAIARYQAQTLAFEKDNERLSTQLEMARNGERIRNLAQNELGMLRPERAQHVTIYIQTPEAAHQTLQQNEEPRMELLDILLGLLDVLHIGE